MTYEDGQFVIGVANGYAKEWIEQRKLTDIKKMLGERMSRGVDVRLTVMTHNMPGYTPSAETSKRAEPAAAHAQPAHSVNGNGHNAGAAQPFSDGLQTRYTFEAFVVGSGNRMAHAAAMSVAEMPAERYNPLFLYGGSGLGKTHLLHAIGNDAKQRGLSCRYVTSEVFTNELISAIRSQSQESFRDKYRYVDVLLMDDIAIHRRQGIDAGRVLSHLQCLARRQQTDCADQRPRAENDGDAGRPSAQPV